jgi:hypothetical protein
MVAGADGVLDSDRILEVEVPPFTYPSLKTIQWESSAGGASGSTVQKFQARWFGYISDGTPGRLLVMDPFAERLVDGNPSPTNNFINLDCDPEDAIIQVSAPVDLAMRTVQIPNTVPPRYADREIFFVSEVTLDTLATDSRLFGVSVQDHRLIKRNGVVLPGTARAVGIEQDAAGVSQAYVARSEADAYGILTMVNVDPNSPERWTINDGIEDYPGIPKRLLVHKDTSGTIMAYVTSVECRLNGAVNASSGMMMMDLDGEEPPLPPDPHCRTGPDCGGGGGGGFTGRRLWLMAIDVTDPAAATTQTFQLSEVPDVICDSSTVFDNIGMAMSLNEDKLFIANPDANTVEVLDLGMYTLSSIGVGQRPVDVAIVKAGGLETHHRAYVLNQLDHSVHIIDVTTGAYVTPFPIELAENPPDPSLRPIAIAARSDGRRLFTADGTHQSLTIVAIDPQDPLTENTRLGAIPVQGGPLRLELLAIPGS